MLLISDGNSSLDYDTITLERHWKGWTYSHMHYTSGIHDHLTPSRPDLFSPHMFIIQVINNIFVPSSSFFLFFFKYVLKAHGFLKFTADQQC